MGKTSSDLQSSVVISSNNAVSGTSLWVSDYTGYSDVPAEQAGNYLALTATTDLDGATISATYNNEELTLVGGNTAVIRIADGADTITFTANKEGYTEGRLTLDLSDLTLEPAPAPVSTISWAPTVTCNGSTYSLSDLHTTSGTFSYDDATYDCAFTVTQTKFIYDRNLKTQNNNGYTGLYPIVIQPITKDGVTYNYMTLDKPTTGIRNAKVVMLQPTSTSTRIELPATILFGLQGPSSGNNQNYLRMSLKLYADSSTTTVGATYTINGTTKITLDTRDPWPDSTVVLTDPSQTYSYNGVPISSGQTSFDLTNANTTTTAAPITLTKGVYSSHPDTGCLFMKVVIDENAEVVGNIDLGAVGTYLEDNSITPALPSGEHIYRTDSANKTSALGTTIKIHDTAQYEYRQFSKFYKLTVVTQT